MINIEMPRCFGPVCSVRASTPHQRAYCPHDTQVFCPFRTKWSSCSEARRAQGGEVRPGLGLREPLAPDLVGRQDRRDVAGALLVVAEAQQRRPEDVEPDDIDELRRARGRELLVDDDLLGRRAAASAELAGPRATHEAGLVARRLPFTQDRHPLVKLSR